MQPNLLMAIMLPIFSCFFNPPLPGAEYPAIGAIANDDTNPFSVVAEIPLPGGYSRITMPADSFGEWLRNFPLKKDKTVYIFNGRQKFNQTAQFAVLNISIGRKDLQQCADAIMRLRAEYLYEYKRYGEISFRDNNGTKYNFIHAAGRNKFDEYLEKVFSWCGTLSLEKQLEPVSDLADIIPGDVLIKGGSPGHAAIVMDVAMNNKGEKIYLLANSYMPAQDIHIVINPVDKNISPWFAVNTNPLIKLPEWTFTIKQLRRW